MTNIEKFNKIFMELLGVEEKELEELKYQDVQSWDSVGHMGLIAELEEVFQIEMDADDIIDFSSYKIGKEILKKYEIEI